MKFDVYDWSDSSYRNAKAQIQAETTQATKALLSVHRNMEDAHIESKGYNEDKWSIGLDTKSTHYIMKGVDYKAMTPYARVPYKGTTIKVNKKHYNIGTKLKDSPPGKALYHIGCAMVNYDENDSLTLKDISSNACKTSEYRFFWKKPAALS